MKLIIMVFLALSTLACAQTSNYAADNNVKRGIAQIGGELKAETSLILKTATRAQYFMKLKLEYDKLKEADVERREAISKKLSNSAYSLCEEKRKEIINDLEGPVEAYNPDGHTVLDFTSWSVKKREALAKLMCKIFKS